MKKSVQILLVLLLTIKTVSAQNYFGLLNEGRNIISAGVGANPDLNMNAAYLTNVSSQPATIEKYGFLAQVNFPVFSQKGFDVDFRLGAGMLVNVSGKFKSIAGVSWNISRTEDLNGRYFHSGFKIDLLPGYYGQHWVVAPHLSFAYQPWIHIKHSEYVAEAFEDLYPNGNGQYNAPKNGWFYQNNITFQTGIGIAYLQPQWNINLTAGFQYQPNRLGLVGFPDIGIMPFYGSFNFGYALPDR